MNCLEVEREIGDLGRTSIEYDIMMRHLCMNRVSEFVSVCPVLRATIYSRNDRNEPQQRLGSTVTSILSTDYLPSATMQSVIVRRPNAHR